MPHPALHSPPAPELSASHPASAGEWRTLRADEQLIGCSTLHGNIRSPRVSWKYPLGGMMQEITLLPTGHGFDLVYCSGGCVIRSSPTGAMQWKSSAYGVHGVAAIDDLDADGRLEIVVSSGLELLVLSAETGGLVWRATVGYPVSMGAFAFTILCHQLDTSRPHKQLVVPLFSSKEILIYDFAGGVEHGRVLQKLWMDDAFHPTTAIADMDGDGIEEIVCAKLGGLYVFDPLTGAMKTQFRWESGGERRRTYGFLKLVDLDQDGGLEVVSLANRVSRHLAVIDNDGRGNLSLLCDRFIEHIYPSDTTEVRYVANSVSDVDGDGRLEIVVSLYNTRGDHRWYVEVIDPLTARAKSEIKDSYLYGVQDVDDDGVGEILVSRERERMPALTSELRVYDWIDSHFIEVWAEGDARFAGHGALPEAATSNFRPDCLAHDETWHAEVGDARGFVVLKEDHAGTTVWCIDLRRPNDQYSFHISNPCGLRIAQIADLDGCGKNELVLTSHQGEILVVRGNGDIVSKTFSGVRLPTESAFASAKPAPIALVFNYRGEKLLAVPDNYRSVHVLQPRPSGQAPTLLLKRIGKGRWGYDFSFHTLSVADIDGDGDLEVLVTDLQAPQSRLLALSPSGELRCTWDFPDYLTSRPGSRLGLYDWCVVNSQTAEPLLFVSFYASTSMNSEQSLCVGAQSRRIMWEKKEIGTGEDGRGFGPWGTISLRETKNRRVETFFLAKDTFCHFDSLTGEFLHEPWQLRLATIGVMENPKEQNASTWGSEDDPFTAYGSVLVADVNNDGEDEFIVGGCIGGFGVLRSDHSILWWKRRVYNDLVLRLPGVVDVDGDGVKEIGVGHADGKFACYSGADGSEKWSIKLGTITTDILSCDIDGDGHAEFITGTSDGRLLAIGEEGVKWEYQFGYSVGSPIIADFDNDGLPEVIVSVGDGYLYSIVNAS